MGSGKEKNFFVILDNIRSIENVGSIFRSSDAFGINKIYLCGISGVIYRGAKTVLNPKISKTALGAEKNIPWEYCRQTWRIVEDLKKQGVFVVALEIAKGAIDISKFKPKFPLALVLGNEVSGISKSLRERCHKTIQIPMLGKKESLNVAVSFGIAGFEINKNRLGLSFFVDAL